MKRFALVIVLGAISFISSVAHAQIAGKYYDTEYLKGAKQVAEACSSGADTIVEFTGKSVDFHENSCKISKIEPWPQSKTNFDYFVRCTGGGRKARLIIEKTGNDRVWIQWDDSSARSKTAGAIYQKCPATEVAAEKPSTNLPKRIGSCVETTITKMTDRFGKPLGSASTSGTIVYFANGGHQVSYDTENSIVRSKLGDRVSMCLKSIPKGCPPGDERGKIFNTRNLRTDEAWTLPDEQHSCGGA
ncbi:hypothetical protein [Tardiphaga sp. P5_C7]